jgi:hypothetical protein
MSVLRNVAFVLIFEYALLNSMILYLATHGEYDPKYATYRLMFGARFIRIHEKFKLRFSSKVVDIHSLGSKTRKMKFLFANACESALHLSFLEKAYHLGIVLGILCLSFQRFGEQIRLITIKRHARIAFRSEDSDTPQYRGELSGLERFLPPPDKELE